MSYVQEAVFTVLRDSSDVYAIAESRIYPLVVPQEVWSGPSKKPCVVYRLSNLSRQSLFCGTGLLQQAALNVDVLAVTYRDMMALKLACTKALLDFRGAVSGVWIDNVQWSTSLELVDSEPGLYRTAMTFTIWFKE